MKPEIDDIDHWLRERELGTTVMDAQARENSPSIRLRYEAIKERA